eukprot:COSAG01_NODE_8360_length_2817_cov_3.679176_1_plen_300_part_00
MPPCLRARARARARARHVVRRCGPAIAPGRPSLSRYQVGLQPAPALSVEAEGGDMNAAILLMMVYWAYKSFGLIGVLGFPAMFLGMLYFRQNGMLYVNAMKSYAMLPSNSHFNLAYEELRIKCADGVHICAWLVTQPGRVGGKNVAPTLIFFHGNAGTIAERLPNTDGLVKQCGCNVLMVEYRGYGTSEGTPSEPGLVADAQGALDALRERSDVDTGKIYVFGRSLGGAVAIKLAHDNPGVLRGVIVENTFTSINSMAMALFPFLQIIPADLCERLLENHWHSDLLIGVSLPPRPCGRL